MVTSDQNFTYDKIKIRLNLVILATIQVQNLSYPHAISKKIRIKI